MSDTVIPVTYPGHADSALIFRQDASGLSVRRSWARAEWKPVGDCIGVLNEHDPNDVAVTINGDLRYGMPFYVHMDPVGFQRLHDLIQAAADSARSDDCRP